MRVFQGCIRGDEIARVRKGSNPLTSDLVRKSAPQDPAPPTPPENADMDAAELAKAQRQAVTTLLTMDDVQKSHYLGLDEAAQTAFLAKGAAERKSEADTAKSLKDRETAEADAAKAGKTTREVELEKRLADQGAEIEVLKGKSADAEVEKRARDEFDGFPGGVAEVVPLLKAYAKLPEADRKASEAVLKSQAAFAKTAGANIHLMSDDEVTKAFPAQAELTKKAKEALAADPTLKTLDRAKGRVLGDDANADLYRRVAAEENAAKAVQ